MRSLSRTESIDKKVSMFIALQVTLMGAKNILVQGVPFLFNINDKLNLIIVSIVSVLYLYALLLVSKRKTCSSAKLFALFIIVSIGFTLVVFPQNTAYMGQYYLRWIVVFFMTAMLISKLKTFEWLSHYILVGSFFITFSGVLYVFFISLFGHSTTSDWSAYSMSMSNVVMLGVMWQLHAFFKKKSYISLLFAVAGLVVIIMYGSRNPLIAIFLYAFLLYFDNTKTNRSAASSIKMLFLIGFLLLGGLFWRSILISIASLLDSFGIQSRSIWMLLNADTNDFSTGRDDIHKDISGLIWEHPIMGTGICGDEANMDELAHSLYLSIYITFGVIIGTFFLMAVIILCIKALKRAKGVEHQVLVMYLCLVFPRGFTGGDLWVNDIFWWLMGIVFMILSNSKINRKNAAIGNIRQESVSMA